MKKTQLPSFVFSLVMITGVAAGNAVYAESYEKQNDLKERLANFCNMTDTEKRVVLFGSSKNCPIQRQTDKYL